VLGHLSFGVKDLARSADFYDRALAPLGYLRVWAHDHGVGFGQPGGGDKLALFAKPGQVVAPGPGFHLALTAPSRAAVDAFHAAAVAAGAEVLHPPRVWPEYHPGYYGAFVRDLDGNNVEAVCHTPQ